MIFLSLRFYVESIFGILEVQNLPVLYIYMLWIMIFIKFSIFEVWSLQNNKIQTPKKAKTTFLELQDWPKLISHGIWMKEKSWNTQILYLLCFRNASEQTRRNIRIIFDALCANPKVGVQRLDGLLCSIPRSENILQVHNEEGYNLLQICVGLNNLELIRWCLSRSIDINRGACSLPFHIACLKG